MLIPSTLMMACRYSSSLSRRVNANSQPIMRGCRLLLKLIKKGEC